MADLEPMGDQGVLARLRDEGEAVHWAAAVRSLAPAWLLDVVQAYTTVAIFHDPTLIGVRGAMEHLARVGPHPAGEDEGRLHVLPCCYERGPDLLRVAQHFGLTAAEVIRLHSRAEYTVYAIGFCPGFPYLGYLPAELTGMPRLESPRVRVEPGSVGLTGRQTGIYTEPRPGGWSLVGQVPVLLVDVATGYFPLRTGDRVRFEPISEAEYGRRKQEDNRRHRDTEKEEEI
jgi:inhibitor of KinA